MSVLAAQGVRKSFGAVTAAADISLSFDADTVVGLIGANGAGKTTFRHIVTGYLKPDSGRILFDGRDIVGLNPRQIARLGISRSFQIPQLFQTLSVRDNLLIAESIAAPFVAAAIFEALRTVASQYAPNVWQMSLGLAMLAIIMFLPTGLWSLARRRAA